MDLAARVVASQVELPAVPEASQVVLLVARPTVVMTAQLLRRSTKLALLSSFDMSFPFYRLALWFGVPVMTAFSKKALHGSLFLMLNNEFSFRR
jgi:hypothetical protein